MLSTSSFDFDGGFGREEFREDVDWDDGSQGSLSATAEAERVAPWEYFSRRSEGARIALVALIVEWFFCVDVVETAQTAPKSPTGAPSLAIKAGCFSALHCR